jgi:type I site-specific restriction endonuclease
MNNHNRVPEQRAREVIDHLLREAGWIIQDNANFNRNAAEGVAVQADCDAPAPLGRRMFQGYAHELRRQMYPAH